MLADKLMLAEATAGLSHAQTANVVDALRDAPCDHCGNAFVASDFVLPKRVAWLDSKKDVAGGIYGMRVLDLDALMPLASQAYKETLLPGDSDMVALVLPVYFALL